ncbi:MAG: orotidine-5'-phosphate decarboxylase [Alphaproteobacteria bacterium CG11_big_fil_rev_8_21_14_0_20_39_49]|nr:MAG: orotidine-5'-phosphate decarboxylase [Alphaproteobacteria bacterium CG11_big_fil_rev_8_21_14_0_20_39_49]
MTNIIICAIDTKDIKQAKELALAVKDSVAMVKCGLEFFTAHGAEGIKEVASTGIDIFLDLKFHDIPNTVAEAVKSAVSLDVSIITIHALGGKAMMQAASYAAKEEAAKLGKQKPLIVGVTVLTSMDDNELNGIGIDRTAFEQVEILAKLAKESGLDGIVCSPHEIKSVKSICGKDFVTVVPGIRPDSGTNDDQRRVMTPKQAVNEGADYIVIGRPITRSKNPAKTAHDIFNSIK